MHICSPHTLFPLNILQEQQQQMPKLFKYEEAKFPKKRARERYFSQWKTFRFSFFFLLCQANCEHIVINSSKHFNAPIYSLFFSFFYCTSQCRDDAPQFSILYVWIHVYKKKKKQINRDCVCVCVMACRQIKHNMSSKSTIQIKPSVNSNKIDVGL